MRTRKSISFGLILCLAGCGGAGSAAIRSSDVQARVVDFGHVDRDRDDELDASEFEAATQPFHQDFDADESGRLALVELANGLFAAWDADRSGWLDESEIRRGATAWLPADDTSELHRWDGDGDGRIGHRELEAGLARLRVFESWDDDGDGSLTDRELSNALFASWDIDGDEAIDALEWRFD